MKKAVLFLLLFFQISAVSACGNDDPVEPSGGHSETTVSGAVSGVNTQSDTASSDKKISNSSSVSSDNSDSRQDLNSTDQTAVEGSLSCSEMGENNIVFIYWHTKWDGYDMPVYVDGKYIISNGDMFKFELPPMEPENCSADSYAYQTTGGIKRLEAFMDTLPEYSEFIGCADHAKLDEAYLYLKNLNTDDAFVYDQARADASSYDSDFGYFYEESLNDSVFTEQDFYYGYAKSDGRNIFQDETREFDYISEENGTRKVLLRAVNYSKTIMCTDTQTAALSSLFDTD